jgi:hypothetical protein
MMLHNFWWLIFDSQWNNLAAVCSGTLLVFAELSVITCALVIGDGSGCKHTAQNAAQSSVFLFGAVTLNFKVQRANFVPKRLQTCPINVTSLYLLMSYRKNIISKG